MALITGINALRQVISTSTNHQRGVAAALASAITTAELAPSTTLAPSWHRAFHRGGRSASARCGGRYSRLGSRAQFSRMDRH